MKMRYRKHYKHNSIHKPKFPTLKCTCCGNYYHAWWTSEQASNCASYFHKDNIEQFYIYGSYPSNFDTMKFTITNNDIVQQRHIIAFNNRENTRDKWGHYNDSPLVVCDNCIRKYVDKGYIVEDTSYNAFAGIEELNSFYNEDPHLYYTFVSQGPYECMRLIKEEREKPIDQRLEERRLREKDGNNKII